MANKHHPKRFRAEFRQPPDFDLVASVWTLKQELDGKTVFTLLQDYPEFTPGAGWRLLSGGQVYEVISSRDLELTCTVIH